MGTHGRRTHGRARQRLAYAFTAAALCLSLMLLAGSIWVLIRFGAIHIEQLILNLPIENGEGVGNDSYIGEVVFFCILLPVAVTVLALLGVRLWRTSAHRQMRPGRIRRTVVRLAVPAGLLAALALFLSVVGVPQYAIAALDGRSVSGYYRTPTLATEPEGTKKNLITIYMESMENTFSDADLFGENLLEPLNEATQGWAEYDGLHQYSGGGWTMAGIVSTQCGIPLKSRLLTTGIDPNRFGETVSSYLPEATCLGDVLEQQGYTGVFLGGAASGFAGKSTFLADHGYGTVLGLSDWQAAGEDTDEISEQWGLSDNRLFQNARATVDALEASESPYNLTLLTLDTHEPGQLYPSCAAVGETTLADSITCSMQAVADFLTYLSDAGYLDDTVVVVMGDHLKGTGAGNQYQEELSSVDDRTVVFRVWNAGEDVEFTRDSSDQLSVMPTVLDLLGLPLTDGQGGLGVSFVGESVTEGTLLELPQSEYESLLAVPSNDLYERLWGDASDE